MTNIDTYLFCEIFVKSHDKAVCCDLCNKQIHVKCNNLNDLSYKNFKLRNQSWYCEECIQEIVPFCSNKVDPNNINSEHSSIDPNLKKICKCKYRDVSYYET